MTHATINGVFYVVRLASGGRIVPADADQKEPWTCNEFLETILVPRKLTVISRFQDGLVLESSNTEDKGFLHRGSR